MVSLDKLALNRSLIVLLKKMAQTRRYMAFH